MKIKYFHSFVLLVLCLFCWATAIAAEDHPEEIVAVCFDGDTVKLKDRRVVRLAGIDAPEKAHKDSPAQYYSKQAKETLEALVRGQKVKLEFPGIKEKDRHGRLVANLILPDGRSVNELMISNGAAFFYPHQDLNPAFQEKLRNLQEEAINERRGLWAHLLTLPLANNNYIGSRNSLRFFPADCIAARRIKPRNAENFGTLMDAFLAGYAPARICVFWPTE